MAGNEMKEKLGISVNRVSWMQSGGGIVSGCYYICHKGIKWFSG
jgi:hypothetical protein